MCWKLNPERKRSLLESSSHQIFTFLPHSGAQISTKLGFALSLSFLATFNVFRLTGAVNESWTKRFFFQQRRHFSAHSYSIISPYMFDLIFLGHSYFIFCIPIDLTHCADISPHCHIKFHFKIDVAIHHSWTCIFTHFRFAKCKHVSINNKDIWGCFTRVPSVI